MPPPPPSGAVSVAGEQPAPAARRPNASARRSRRPGPIEHAGSEGWIVSWIVGWLVVWIVVWLVGRGGGFLITFIADRSSGSTSSGIRPGEPGSAPRRDCEPR